MFGRKIQLRQEKVSNALNLNNPVVIVQESERDAGGLKLVHAVARYVDLMTEEGLFETNQLPAGVIQAYHADLYHSLVSIGGHAHYARSFSQSRSPINYNVAKALAAMGANFHAGIFSNYLKWLDMYPMIGGQNKHPLRSKETLDALDAKFTNLNNHQSLPTLNSKWIASWDHLIAVPNDDYNVIMNKMFDLNMKRVSTAE